MVTRVFSQSHFIADAFFFSRINVYKQDLYLILGLAIEIHF